jgi:hypothetical protein
MMTCSSSSSGGGRFPSSSSDGTGDFNTSSGSSSMPETSLYALLATANNNSALLNPSPRLVSLHLPFIRHGNSSLIAPSAPSGFRVGQVIQDALEIVADLDRSNHITLIDAGGENARGGTDVLSSSSSSHRGSPRSRSSNYRGPYSFGRNDQSSHDESATQ